MFYFTKDHWIHQAVKGHDANVQTARAHAATWAQQQTQHAASHSFVDMSNVRDGDEYVANTGVVGA